MLELSTDLSLLQKKTTSAPVNVKKNEPWTSVHEILSSNSFANYSILISLITKFCLIPICYATPAHYSPFYTYQRGIDAKFIHWGFYVVLCLNFLLYGMRTARFHFRKTNIHSSEPFGFKMLAKTVIHIYIINLITFHIMPRANLHVEMCLIGYLVILLDLLYLYSYFTCDYLALMEKHDDMELYEAFEDVYGTKKVDILESTSTCITLKNVSEEDLDAVFEIGRLVSKKNKKNEYKWQSWEALNEKKEIEYLDDDSQFRQFCHAKKQRIAPGQVFKIVTVAYNVEDLKEGERCFILPQYRVFGMDVDDVVMTTFSFLGSQKPFHVCLTQKYETEIEKIKRVAGEKLAEEELANKKKQLPLRVIRDITKKYENGEDKKKNRNNDDNALPVLSIKTTAESAE